MEMVDSYFEATMRFQCHLCKAVGDTNVQDMEIVDHNMFNALGYYLRVNSEEIFRARSLAIRSTSCKLNFRMSF